MITSCNECRFEADRHYHYGCRNCLNNPLRKKSDNGSVLGGVTLIIVLTIVGVVLCFVS
jgi:hypothetical protein